jgi:outer membrane lipoprotein
MVVVLIAVAAAGCATGPRFDTKEFDKRLTPAEAVKNSQGVAGTRVLWGGMIINTNNLDKGSEVEVLAYPLAPSQRPDIDKAPLGRFIARTSEYLESVDFAQGRLITVAGLLAGTREGKIGETHYVYPVVEPEAGHIYLWPVGSGRRTEPQFSIGVGVLFGR